jgi:serine/threonine-protein kinase
MRDLDAGLPLLQEARERWGKLVPEAHPIFTHMQAVSAVFADMRGQSAAAARDLREAAAGFKAGARPVDAAATEVTLAGIRFAHGDRKEARQLLEEALPVLRDSVLPTHVSRAEGEALARKLGMPGAPAAASAQLAP